MMFHRALFSLLLLSGSAAAFQAAQSGSKMERMTLSATKNNNNNVASVLAAGVISAAIILPLPDAVAAPGAVAQGPYKYPPVESQECVVTASGKLCRPPAEKMNTQPLTPKPVVKEWYKNKNPASVKVGTDGIDLGRQLAKFGKASYPVFNSARDVSPLVDAFLGLVDKEPVSGEVAQKVVDGLLAIPDASVTKYARVLKNDVYNGVSKDTCVTLVGSGSALKKFEESAAVKSVGSTKMADLQKKFDKANSSVPKNGGNICLPPSVTASEKLWVAQGELTFSMPKGDARNIVNSLKKAGKSYATRPELARLVPAAEGVFSRNAAALKMAEAGYEIEPTIIGTVQANLKTAPTKKGQTPAKPLKTASSEEVGADGIALGRQLSKFGKASYPVFNSAKDVTPLVDAFLGLADKEPVSAEIAQKAVDGLLAIPDASVTKYAGVLKNDVYKGVSKDTCVTLGGSGSALKKFEESAAVKSVDPTKIAALQKKFDPANSNVPKNDGNICLPPSETASEKLWVAQAELTFSMPKEQAKPLVESIKKGGKTYATRPKLANLVPAAEDVFSKSPAAMKMAEAGYEVEPTVIGTVKAALKGPATKGKGATNNMKPDVGTDGIALGGQLSKFGKASYPVFNNVKDVTPLVDSFLGLVDKEPVSADIAKKAVDGLLAIPDASVTKYAGVLRNDVYKGVSKDSCVTLGGSGSALKKFEESAAVKSVDPTKMAALQKKFDPANSSVPKNDGNICLPPSVTASEKLWVAQGELTFSMPKEQAKPLVDSIKKGGSTFATRPALAKLVPAAEGVFSKKADALKMAEAGKEVEPTIIGTVQAALK